MKKQEQDPHKTQQPNPVATREAVEAAISFSRSSAATWDSLIAADTDAAGCGAGQPCSPAKHTAAPHRH
jgi:hypothetical protein